MFDLSPYRLRVGEKRLQSKIMCRLRDLKTQLLKTMSSSWVLKKMARDQQPVPMFLEDNDLYHYNPAEDSEEELEEVEIEVESSASREGTPEKEQEDGDEAQGDAPDDDEGDSGDDGDDSGDPTDPEDEDPAPPPAPKRWTLTMHHHDGGDARFPSMLRTLFHLLHYNAWRSTTVVRGKDILGIEMSGMCLCIFVYLTTRMGEHKRFQCTTLLPPELHFQLGLMMLLGKPSLHCAMKNATKLPSMHGSTFPVDHLDWWVV